MKRMIPVLLFLLCATLVTAGEQKSPATAPGTDSLYVFTSWRRMICFISPGEEMTASWQGSWKR